jgi:hypothetical protein
MNNPYSRIPIDRGGNVMQEYATIASVVAVYASENGATSSVITLTPDTTTVEIAAVGGTGVMRWVRTGDGTGAATSVVSAVGGANFNHVIPTANVRKFAVPIETTYQAPSSMVGINIQNGLYRRVAYKTVGNASILVTEYAANS